MGSKCKADLEQAALLPLEQLQFLKSHKNFSQVPDINILVDLA